MTYFPDNSPLLPDTTIGSDGADIIAWEGGDDLVDGLNGKDVLLINEQSSNFSIHRMKSGVTLVNGLYEDYTPWSGDTATLMNVEYIEFLDKVIKIKKNSNKDEDSSNSDDANEPGYNEIYGTRRDDDLYGSRGDDRFDGGKGWDYVNFSKADNTVDLNKKSWQQTGDGWDMLISIEGVNGRGGDDWLIAHNKFDSYLLGGNGNDWLTAGRHGNNRLWGGADTDTFEVKKGKGHAIIEDFVVGEDWIYFEGNPRRLGLHDGKNGQAELWKGNDLLAVINGASGLELISDGGGWYYL